MKHNDRMTKSMTMEYVTGSCLSPLPHQSSWLTNKMIMKHNEKTPWTTKYEIPSLAREVAGTII